MTMNELFGYMVAMNKRFIELNRTVWAIALAVLFIHAGIIFSFINDYREQSKLSQLMMLQQEQIIMQQKQILTLQYHTGMIEEQDYKDGLEQLEGMQNSSSGD